MKKSGCVFVIKNPMRCHIWSYEISEHACNDVIAKALGGMKGVCAGHVRRTALVDGARIGAQNAILCLCNTTLGIHLRVHGAHNVRYKSPSGARKSNIPYWSCSGQSKHDCFETWLKIARDYFSFIIRSN